MALREMRELRQLEVADREVRGEGALTVDDLRDVAARVDAAPPPTFLASPVWPEDAYGVIAAEDKAGKTWAATDLGVSVASGADWLGAFPCERGPVLMFLGEGGERRSIRRLRAVCRANGAVAEDLPIRLCFRVPHLTDAAHLAAVRAELAAYPPRLAMIDPLYLAARGARGSQLYEMGEALENLQHATQDAGAALVVVTHYNKTGEGRGPKRITGAGPGAWGRVLATADVVSRSTDGDGTTRVVLEWEFSGDEIADQRLRVLRRVRAENAADLSSPLTYEVERVQDDAPEARPGLEGVRPATLRVLSVLEAESGDLTVRDIGDLLEAAGRPLRARTIQTALNELKGASRADSRTHAHGALVWRATCVRPEDEPCA